MKTSISKVKIIQFIALASLSFTCNQAEAQRRMPVYEQPKDNSGNILAVNILFGGHLPAADLADRFGSFASAGLGVDFITAKDWLIGAHGDFRFGTKVEEDVIASVRSQEDGLIFGLERDIAAIELRKRGMNAGLHIGRLFRLDAEQRSGIRVSLGAGFFQHKVRIQDDPVVFVPQLDKTYKRGYDRLSNGLSLTQFVGYQHLGAMRRGNFTIGAELTQAFTKNRRNFNFDTRSQDDSARLDLVFGIRVGWQLPFYLGESAENIRY